MAAAPGYIFGGNTGVTAESLKRRRALVEAMAEQARNANPRNVGEGINALGGAIASAISGSALRRDEAALQEKQSGLWSDLGSAINTGGGSALAYDPAGSSISSDTSAAANLKPADREGYAMDYLVGKGLQPYQAAGVVGNLIQESSLNTGARNRGDGSDGSDSIGVGQWNGNRAHGLRSFAANSGRNVGDLDTQLDYVLHELDGSESAAGKALRSARNVDEATAAMIGYERPAGWSVDNPRGGHGWGNRIGHAQRLFQAGYGARANAADTTTPAPVPSTAQAVTNALAMQGADRNGRMAGGPVQAASLDPSIGMDTALAYSPRRGMDVTPTAPDTNTASVAAPAVPVSPTPAALPPGQQRIADTLMQMPANVRQAATADAGFDGFAQTDATPYAGQGAPEVPKVQQLAQAMEVGEARTGRNPTALLRVLQSPYASDEQRQLAGQLLNHLYSRQEKLQDRAYEENSPDAVLNRRYKQAQIDAATGKAGGYRTLTADEASRMGLPAGAAYQVSPDGKVDAIGNGKGQQINVGGGENTSEFVKKSDEAAAKRLGDIVDAGNAAPAFIGDIQQLADLGRQIGTGKGAQITAALGPYADMLGIKLEGLDETQAYNSIVSRIAPNMRPAGAGATSDFDARQYLSSLPSLANTPGGNEIITATFGAIQQNKIDAAEIAQRAQSGEIKWQDAERQIRALPNPYQRYREFRKNGSGSGSTTTPPAAGAAPASSPPAMSAPRRARNPQTGAIIEFRNGQWVPAQ